MNAKILVSFRYALAAGSMLAVLALAYYLAGRLPASPLVGTATTHPCRSRTDTTVIPARRSLTPEPTALLPALSDEQPHCPAQPIRFVAPRPAQPPLQLRRYVGTVGGQPATALLQWRTPTELSGRFYLHLGGPEYRLASEQQPGKLWVENQEDEQVGEWHLASQPGGAVLRGTWHDSTGNHPFYLRESYAGAVRATVRTLRLTGGQMGREPSSPEVCEAGSYQADYLQLTSPWPVASALRRALGPPLAVVRRRLRASYEEAHNQSQELNAFLLNDFNLLSYKALHFRAMIGDEGKGDYWVETYLFDLATGRELTLASQLQPGYERPLRRLMREHLLHDNRFDFINKDHQGTWNWLAAAGRPATLPRLPDTDRETEATIGLTGSGLTITYPPYAGICEIDISGQREIHVYIPYAELRPLVRPGTPLARMLRARGLW